ncbi:hypothetical protein [Thalassobellus suaedae]|uniref:Uncharacterized protein n=1 Tax=Thalassobellus suaedae TaxID=3074124 RepID=A0ABY9Y534_9FLAO|nr:hypothetical protein RHP49_01785 [Flavobacteriaceae bacterium HL-DH10]
MISLIKYLLSDRIISNSDSISDNHINTIKNMIIKLGIEYDYLELERVIFCENKFTFSKGRIAHLEDLRKFYLNKIKASNDKDEIKSLKNTLERIEPKINSDTEKIQLELKNCKEVLNTIDNLIEGSTTIVLKENYRLIKNIVLELMAIYDLIEIEYNYDCIKYEEHQNIREIEKLEEMLSDVITLIKDISKELELNEIWRSKRWSDSYKVEYVNLLIDNRFTLITKYFSNLKEKALSNDRLVETLLLEKNIELLKSYRTVNRKRGRRARGST